MSFSSTRQIGLPAGGLTGQALVKLSNNDFDVAWGTGSGTGGSVTSVFGRTGVIVPQSGDYDSDLVPEQVGANNLYFTNTRARAVFSNTAPINYSAGVYSITLASNSANGYISSTDWTTFNNKGTGTVTSVGLTVPSWLTVSAPVTTTGTLAITATSGQTANQVMATPDGATGAMSLRALVENDIPNLDASKITSGYLSPILGGGGVPFYGDGSDGNVTISGLITLQRDMYYNNLTVTGLNVIITGAYRIFVAGILDLTGITTGGIGRGGANGTNASGATGGGGGAQQGANTLGGSGGQASGSAGVSGTTGVGAAAAAVGTSLTTLGGSSGRGGAGGGLGAVGTAGTAGGTRTDNKINFFDFNLLRGAALYTGGQSAPGGSAGNGNGTLLGGGGGGGASGASVVAIFANIIKRDNTTAANAIRSPGNNGGIGGNATGGGGGGGGGGSAGGCVYIVYNSLQGSTGTNIISANGGNGGQGGIGSAGYYGGTGGTGGGSGRIILINASTGVVTEYDGTTVAGNTAAAPTGTAGTAGGTGAILQASL